MSQPAPRQEERYTYADYLKWDDGERWEIIYGKPYLMAPAPSTDHQGISRDITLQIGSFLKGKQCKVFYAPFDVRLFPRDDDTDDTIVQPDIVVVCDRSKFMRTGYSGAPDMVIEILSPRSLGQKSECSDFEADFLPGKADFRRNTSGISRKYDEDPAENPPKDGRLGLLSQAPCNSGHDTLLKFNLYRRAGVREYWIVDPVLKTVSTHILNNGEYMTRMYGREDSAPVHVLEGLEIELSEIFEEDTDSLLTES